MQTSLSWLHDLISFDLDADTLADELTSIGTAVQWIRPLLPPSSELWTVEVIGCDPHPDAERLHVCRIRAADGEHTVVCGAPNVRRGLRAVWVAPGGTLADGRAVGAAEIRGVPSEGMLLSETEMGLSGSADVIVELPVDTPVGMPAADVFVDSAVSFELTPNRPDCLSTFGIAREIGAVLKRPFRFPDFERTPEGPPLGDDAPVRIEDPEGCPRYAAALIEGLKVGPSPWWLRQRILACGMRPINNLVDVTNYVMMETGQPLHAFDFDKLKRRQIVVRASREGEEFTTLDGKTHRLPPEVVLITDGDETIALGGIMGGLDSEVDDGTRTVLLESAYFNPRRTRRARKALGIESEAALRFEKGTDPARVLYALDRAAHLLARLAGGHVRRGFRDEYPVVIEPRQLTLRTERTNRILGLALKVEEVADMLGLIGLDARASGKDLAVTVPTFRPDIEREIDLIEEVARLYGYERIPIREQGGGRLFDQPDHDPAVEEAIHRFLPACGFNEAVTGSLGSRQAYRQFTPDLEPVAVANPLSEDLSHLRTGLLADLCTTAAHNFNRRNLDWCLYTVGLAFLPEPARTAPREELRLALALAGGRAPRFWGGDPGPAGWHDLKGFILDLCRYMRVPEPEFVATESAGFDPAICFHVRIGESQAGVAGKLGPAARHWDIKEPLWLAELFIPALRDAREPQAEYVPLPKFPAVTRDMALVLEEGQSSGQVMETIREAAGELLVSLELFDLYRGKPLASGRKSLAFSLVFRSPERSLQAAEVDDVMGTLIATLKDRHGAELRA